MHPGHHATAGTTTATTTVERGPDDHTQRGDGGAPECHDIEVDDRRRHAGHPEHQLVRHQNSEHCAVHGPAHCHEIEGDAAVPGGCNSVGEPDFRSARGGGLRGSCLWEGVEGVEGISDLDFDGLGRLGRRSSPGRRSATVLSA